MKSFYTIIFIGLFLHISPSLHCQNKLNQFEYEYYLIEAEKNLAFGNLREAGALFNECLKYNPSGAAAYYGLSVIYNMLGKGKEYSKYAYAAYEIDPSNKYYFNNYVYALLKTNEVKTAIKTCKEQADKFHNIKYLLILSDVYLLTKDYKNAYEIIKTIKKEYGANDDIIKREIEMLIELKDINTAESIIDNNCKGIDNDVGLFWLREKIYETKGDIENAKNMLIKIKELNPGDYNAVLSYNKLLIKEKDTALLIKNIKDIVSSEMLTDLDKMQFVFSVYISDTNRYEYLIDRIKNDTVKYDEIIYECNAEILMRNSKYEEALKEYMYIYNKKKDYSSLKNIVSILQFYNRNDEVIALITDAINIFPDKTELLYYKGYSEYVTEKFDSAVLSLETGMYRSKTDKERYLYMEMLGEAYHKIGNFTLSDYYYDKLLMEDPSNITASNNYAYFLSLRDKSLEKAKYLSSTTIEKEPENSTYLDTYAWILYKMKDYRAALKYMNKCIKHNKESNHEIYDHCGDILYANGKINKAIKYWELAISAGGNNLDILTKIENAKK